MSTNADKKRTWCIVGGGLLGMTLAYRLSQQDECVTLLESSATLGGLAEPWQLGPVMWDRHYHVTLLSDRHLRCLLAELDLESDMRWCVTRTGFFANDRLYPLNNALDYLRLPVLGVIDKIRLAATILYASRIKHGHPLEAITVSDWLTRLSGRKVFETIWRPLLRAKLGENYKKTSAAFIWAVIRRLYAARRGELKTEMFGYVPGGYARILQRMSEVLRSQGVEIQLACPTNRVERSSGRLLVEAAGVRRHFDRVVVTTAAPIAARICRGLTEDELQKLNGIVYQGVVCASLLMRRPLANNYLTYITDETIPFTAVIEMTGLVDPAELQGHTLVYLPRYVTQDDQILESSDETIIERFLAALLKIYPDVKREDVITARLSRVRQVLAISTLHYSDHLPPMESSIPGLALVNSAHIVNGTLNVNETVGLAEAALSRLLTTRADEPSIHAMRCVA